MIQVKFARVAEQGGGGETYPHTRTRHAWNCMLNYTSIIIVQLPVPDPLLYRYSWEWLIPSQDYDSLDQATFWAGVEGNT